MMEAFANHAFLRRIHTVDSFTEDGDSWMPFDAGMRRAIYDAASDGKTMTVKRIESVLQRDFFIAHPHVRGTSNPKAMSSKPNSAAVKKCLYRMPDPLQIGMKKRRNLPISQTNTIWIRDMQRIVGTLF